MLLCSWRWESEITFVWVVTLNTWAYIAEVLDICNSSALLEYMKFERISPQYSGKIFQNKFIQHYFWLATRGYLTAKQGPKKSKRWEKIIIERVLGWLWGTSGVGRGHPPLLDRYAGPEFRAKIRSRRSPEAPTSGREAISWTIGSSSSKWGNFGQICRTDDGGALRSSTFHQ